MINYKMTVRRRLANGTLQTATYSLQHVHSSGNDEEQGQLLFDLEMQANNSGTVRVWIEEQQYEQPADVHLTERPPPPNLTMPSPFTEGSR